MHQVKELYPMSKRPITLADFNRVQTRFDLNQRQEMLSQLQYDPVKLAELITNTSFGIILRSENFQEYVS